MYSVYAAKETNARQMNTELDSTELIKSDLFVFFSLQKSQNVD